MADDDRSHIPIGSDVVTHADLQLILDVVVWHKVFALDAPWAASNPSVVVTPDGAQFGPYPDGGAAGGSVRYHALDGQPFGVVENLAYNARYTFDSGVDGGAPYCRIFLLDPAGDEHSVAHTPSTEPFPGLGAGPFQEYVATAGLWRYDDDGASLGFGVPLPELQAQYADHVISKLTISVGYSGGTNLAALLRWWQINGNHLVFGTDAAASDG